MDMATSAPTASSTKGMIGAIMPTMPQVPQAAWTCYIGVGDIDRMADGARAGGGTILHGPSESRAASIR
jgi:predicted enzyme related to lactoylglutathione lyase